MPSKWRRTVLPSKPAGRSNSVRNHHERRNGLSGGVGMFEKLAAMGYDVPGTARRFIPKAGSG